MISGWMTPEELAWLGEQAKTRNVIVEMGCYQGRTTKALAATPGVVYAWDDWKGLREQWWIDSTPAAVRENLFEFFCHNLEAEIVTGKVKTVRASHDEAVTLPVPDMVFIDGDHTYESVKRDIERWLPVVSSGALLCGHDYNQEPLALAVNRTLENVQNPVGLIWSWIKP